MEWRFSVGIFCPMHKAIWPRETTKGFLRIDNDCMRMDEVTRIAAYDHLNITDARSLVFVS